MKQTLTPRLFLLGLLALGASGPLAAQTLPPPSQAQAALQSAISSNPALAGTIRSKLAGSGMTPEQVRAKLQAQGYPANLLDSYLGEQQAGAAPASPTADHVAAITALGLPPIQLDLGQLPVDTGLVRAVQATSPTAAAEGTLTPFGLEVFRRTSTQFLPLLAGPVPPDYRIGAGDQLVLILTGDVELGQSLPVTREGFILIPQVGQVFVSNLTLTQVRDLLYTRLGRVYSGVRRGAGATTQFDVTVANVRAVQVFVVGEAAQPGSFQVSALGTVLTALYAAGGPTENANMRAVEVRRAGKVAATFDLYEYLLKGDTRSDLRLENGDVIYVGPRVRRATVRGAVQREALYDVATNESLADLIQAAGGLLPGAAVQRISIDRIIPAAQRRAGESQRVTVDVPLQAGVIPPFPIEDGDEVRVFSIDAGRRGYVQVDGSVYLPGKFGYRPGMRLSELVHLAGGLKPTTFAGRAHIARFNATDSTRYLIPVPLPKDSLASWPADSVLSDRDEVTLYDRLEMRDSIYVTIAGAVHKPGRYPWRTGMSIRDLVLMAHGLRIGASLDTAEVARLPLDRARGQMAQLLRVPLDSTYLFDVDTAGNPLSPPGLPFRASGSPRVPLQPYDNVTIFRQPEYELQRTVILRGEVRYPGSYALMHRSERLSEIIARAGGLTDRAYPGGVRFYRRLEQAGRVNIDLEEVLRRPGRSRYDLILQPGDSIDVPEYLPTVRISGAVNSPGSVLWQKGKSLSYYIGAAGGFTHSADGKRASVRQPDGEVETKGRGFLFVGGGEPDPGPGAEVYVPILPEQPYRDKTALYALLASVIASTATIVIALTNN
jgi:polysaccharide export outer membrane protein